MRDGDGFRLFAEACGGVGQVAQHGIVGAEAIEDVLQDDARLGMAMQAHQHHSEVVGRARIVGVKLAGLPQHLLGLHIAAGPRQQAPQQTQRHN